MTQEEILDIFHQTGGVLKGHFRLTSGRHADTYMQCAKLFSDASRSEKLCKELSGKLAGYGANLVVSPAVGGILMGYEVSRHLNLKNIFAERENGVFTLRRGFALPESARAVVVEDVVTTGGSVKEVIALIAGLGGKTVAVGSIVDRSAGKVNFGVPFESLLSLEIQSFAPEECPLCAEGRLPLYKPGSRM